MKTTNLLKLLILLFLPLIGKTSAYGQERTTPKKIKTKGDYVHNLTNFIFPEEFEKFTREDVFSFNKDNTNIGVVYQDNNENRISIYIYPAGNKGPESRLRYEYLKSMQEIANTTRNGFKSTQFSVKQTGEYICNGFKAIGSLDKNQYNNLTLYECGTWFLKIRITTNNLDSVKVNELEDKILNKYKPSDLTKLKPLNTKPDILFAKAALADSTLLGSIMGSAFKKSEWAIKNVQENERASGFPDLYLEMHVESIKELLKFRRDHPTFNAGLRTIKYLDEVQSLVNSGYLKEFVARQFYGIIVDFDKYNFDFDGYEKWRKTNNLTINLNERYYLISYGEK